MYLKFFLGIYGQLFLSGQMKGGEGGQILQVLFSFPVLSERQ